MYFGIGGHPGFNIPMEEGLSFEDYELEFSRACEPQRILFSQECFVEGKKSYELFEGRRIPLRHNLFDEDAIVLEKTSGEILLHSTKGKKAVKVSYVDMPYVGFWHMPCMDAPYVCIEPWCSLPSRQGITEIWRNRRILFHWKLAGSARFPGPWKFSRACLKKAFCKMCVTICGRFCLDEGAVAGYGNRIQAKSPAKWGVQIAGMIFQTRSRTCRVVGNVFKYSQGRQGM